MAGNQALPLSSSILQNTVNTRHTGKATRNRLGGSGGQDTRKAGASDGETDIRNKTLTRSGGRNVYRQMAGFTWVQTAQKDTVSDMARDELLCLLQLLIE